MKSDEQTHVTDGSTDAARSEFRLEIPAHSSFVAMARLFAGAVARHFGCIDDVCDDVKVAISETVTNAVKAHMDAATDAPVEVVGRAESDELTFSVIDRGKGFDFSPTAAATTELAVLHRGNLGLALVRSLFPATDIGRNKDAGMTVTFTIDLTSARDISV